MMERQVALVTGASRGIGASVAKTLSDRDFFVIGTATTEQGASSISDALGKNGKGVVLDVRDTPSVDRVVKEVVGEFGNIHVLVNNAGVTKDGLAVRMSEDDWDLVISTNLRAVFMLTQTCVKYMMKARYGRVVNITSVVGSSGNPGQANYCAAKAGVVGMSKSLALELGSRGITVNCVSPGFIDTDMTTKLNDDQREVILSKIPLGRMGLPEEVANAVAFLAGSGAGYVSGVTLHVNGGLYLA
jgi:3-oxoacyl-[acyl-carrier protein] reductase